VAELCRVRCPAFPRGEGLPLSTPALTTLSGVVLDTNVLIASAFRPGSDSGRIVGAVRDGRLKLLWDDPTREEAERLFRKIPPLSWEAVAGLYLKANRRAGERDPAAWGKVSDPEDRKFAALAAAEGALLVSLDAHLLRAGLGTRPEVLTPSELVARLDRI